MRRINRTRAQVKRGAPLLVAIAGGSGSGKTWLAQRLERALDGQALRLSLDDFYLDRSRTPPARRARVNFDHPRAIDWTSLRLVLRRLLSGRPARMPCYDFATHCRLGELRTIHPKPILLLDGLWVLRRKELRQWMGLGIYLDCPADVRFRRRLKRDLAGRGRSRASVRDQFRRMVEPMHARFVAPQRRRADLVLRHGFGEAQVLELAQELRELSSKFQVPNSKRRSVGRASSRAVVRRGRSQTTPFSEQKRAASRRDSMQLRWGVRPSQRAP